MALPSSGIWWKHFSNVTPTFDLTPIEKPDLSPFLIHMTGKNQLVSILKGLNHPDGEEIPEGCGYLKAVMPEFDGHEPIYNSEVVCFTESPIFALDFFRYRSFRRWESDQQYGIGFSKSLLVQKADVRPVIYLDTKTNKEVLKLCNEILNDNYKVVNQNGEIIDLKPLADRIKPLLFPLLENTPAQGFMWEREWRSPRKEGLIFRHKSIKLICCPANEMEEIVQILGDASETISIVQSWKEYDDITNYLKRRDQEAPATENDKIKEIKKLSSLLSLKVQNERTLNTLEAHYSLFKEVSSTMDQNGVAQMLEEFRNKTKLIDQQIDVVKKELEEKKNKDQQTKL